MGGSLLSCLEEANLFGVDKVVAEREKGEVSDLEVLPTKRDTNDGNAKDNTREEIAKRNHPTKQDGPQDVQERFDSVWFDRSDLLSKRPNHESTDLEELQT